MQKILLTGCEGMLGQALVRSLSGGDFFLEGTDIKGAVNIADITDNASVSSLIKRIKPDIVIHTAAYTDVDGCEGNPQWAYLVNEEGTRNIATACRETGAFLIYTSSNYVFDGKKKNPYTEEDTPNPISVYGNSKLKGEQHIRTTLDKYLIIRTSWLFGSGGRNFVDAILDKAKEERRLSVVDDQKGSPTYTADLANTIKILLPSIKNASIKILNITNSGACSWYEFAREILKVGGMTNVSLKTAASNEIGRPAKRPSMSILDNSRLRSIYAIAMPSWQNALLRYIKVLDVKA
jgi:dTDP-4-dehydrorhamnose reductase